MVVLLGAVPAYAGARVGVTPAALADIRFAIRFVARSDRADAPSLARIDAAYADKTALYTLSWLR